MASNETVRGNGCEDTTSTLPFMLHRTEYGLMVGKNLSIASNIESIATIVASIGLIGSEISDIGSMASTSEAHCKYGKDTQKTISIGQVSIGATW